MFLLETKSKPQAIDFGAYLKKLTEPEWMHERRRDLWKRYAAVPQPTRKDEEWKFTDFSGFVEKEPWEFAVAIAAPKGVIATGMPIALEKHQDVLKKFLGSALDRTPKFALFAAASWTNGYFVHVPRNTVVKKPIVVKHFMSEGVASSHSIVIAEEGSRVTVCEIFEGSPDAHYGTLEVIAHPNAHVDIVTVQRFGENTWDYSYKRGKCAADARINWSFALLGGRMSVLREDTSLDGPGASSDIKGVYFGSGKQHYSVFTNNYHLVQNTRANVDTRGVLKDGASSATRGLIRIEKAAKGTDSFLHDRTLHLGGATSHAIPCLEIENNDVRASHGASTGKIDPDQLFYMRTRGLTEGEAETLIVQGFFEPVVDALAGEIREGVREAIQKKIGVK